MRNTFLFALSILTSLQLHAQVGIGTTAPNSMLDVRGSMSASFRTFASGAITTTDYSVVFTGVSNTASTLPTAIGCTGRTYWIKNASSTVPTPVLTINTTSAQTIDGLTSWTIDEPNEIICFVSNGTNWYVLNQNVAVAKTATTGNAWMQGGNRLSSVKSLGTISNFDLPFITNNVEKMRLTTGGFLGIGTTAPVGRIQLVSQGSELGNDYVFDDYGAGTTQGIYLTKSRGAIASPSDLVSGDQIGYFRYVPRYNGIMGSGPGSSMEAFYKGSGSNELTDLRFFTSNTEKMRIGEFGNVGIGATAFNITAPEKLLVDAGTTTSFNVISGKGNINNYLQLNIHNRSNMDSASSDIVASANNGNETINFVDMGINSSGYTSAAAPILSGANTAYLYATGRDFLIGNGSTGRNLILFTNGFAAIDEKMRITSTGNVGIGVVAPTDKLTVGGNIAPSADNLYNTTGKHLLIQILK